MNIFFSCNELVLNLCMCVKRNKQRNNLDLFYFDNAFGILFVSFGEDLIEDQRTFLIRNQHFTCKIDFVLTKFFRLVKQI